MPPTPALPLLAEVVRSGFVEGHHCGSLLARAPGGEVVLSMGTPDAPVFPRSSNKPLQAVGMLTAGLGDVVGTRDDLLAIVCASHSGQRLHRELVCELLGRAGLDERALACPPALPLDEEEARAVLADGGPPTRLAMNCSGKHAGMLATSVAAGWPTKGYLDPAHPLQQAIRASVETLTGERVAAVGVDGCGAPLFALSLAGLGTAFSRLVLAPPGRDERRVADAMRAHPVVVGGRGRDVSQLMAGVPGLLAKDGAEGVYAAATADGAAVTLKIDDGAGRAATPVLVAALRRLGIDRPVLAELAATPVLGGGRPVGAVRSLV